jgi:predicted transcriptional regulator
VTIRNSEGRSLTPLQQAILDFLWSNGPATGEAVREALMPRHPLKDSSVRTLLRRLENQGYLQHSIEGKSFLYSPTAPARKVAANGVRQIIQKFCAGSVDVFLAGMVDEKVLTTEQLERLAKKVRAGK